MSSGNGNEIKSLMQQLGEYMAEMWKYAGVDIDLVVTKVKEKLGLSLGDDIITGIKVNGESVEVENGVANIEVGEGEGTVKSVSVNGGTAVEADADGKVNIEVDTLTADDKAVITANRQNGLHEAILYVPDFLVGLYVNGDGDAISLARADFGLSAYTGTTALADAKSAGVIDANCDIVTMPEGVTFSKYSILESIIQELYRYNELGKLEYADGYIKCKDIEFSLYVGDFKCIRFPSSRVASTIGAGGKLYVKGWQINISDDDDVTLSTLATNQIMNGLADGGVYVLTKPNATIKNRWAAQLYNGNNLLTILEPEIKEVASLDSASATDNDIPSVKAVKDYVAAHGGSGTSGGSCTYAECTEAQIDALFED